MKGLAGTLMSGVAQDAANTREQNFQKALLASRDPSGMGAGQTSALAGFKMNPAQNIANGQDDRWMRMFGAA